MKKLVYLFIIFIGLAITSCEPMEDIHEEIDAELTEGVVGSVDYVLTEENYEDLDLPFGSFDSAEDAGALIPALLTSEFPVWGSGSLVNVSYNLYDPIRVEEYTVTSSDYNAMNLPGDYFSNTSEIVDFLETQYPQAENGEYVELTYSTIADEIQYEINADDFDLIGDELGVEYPTPASSAANFSNFDRREGNAAYWSNEMILEAINVVLPDNFDGVEGQTYRISYSIYDGSPGTENMTVLFNGNAYVAIGGSSYEISAADFDFIGEELGDIYPTPASSAAQYSNFDRRDSNNAYWSEEMILEALNILLAENNPGAVEGDRFEVSYAIYDGAAGTEMMAVILQNGAYVVDEEAVVSTIEETTVYAYANGDWDVPFNLEAEDYTEMGQSYPNFDNEDEAIYKLEIFLGSEFPYAEEGDFVALAYDFFSGGTSTRYANFIFENGDWNYIPSTIEQTIQFGHNGETWEPDNTISRTLSAADFEFIGDALIDVYPGPADSAGYYGNFDRRSGNENYWSEEMLLEAFNLFLDELDPNAEEGQRYVLSYAVYTGSAGTESMSLVKEGGEWIINE